MVSRLFAALDKYVSEVGKSNRGGRGHKSPSKVIRVPHDALHDLDSLIEEWRARCDASPTSPRYEKVAQLLDEIEAILPSASNRVPF